MGKPNRLLKPHKFATVSWNVLHHHQSNQTTPQPQLQLQQHNSNCSSHHRNQFHSIQQQHQTIKQNVRRDRTAHNNNNNNIHLLVPCCCWLTPVPVVCRHRWCKWSTTRLGLGYTTSSTTSSSDSD